MKGTLVKNTFRLAALTIALIATGAAQARDTEHKLPIKDVIEGPEAAKFSNVKFYFGKQPAPAVEKSLGEFTTSQKTNAFNKTDEEACRWVMASALKRLAESAAQKGADAVINVRSNYNNIQFSSETEYECHAGGIMAGVALKAEFVKLK